MTAAMPEIMPVGTLLILVSVDIRDSAGEHIQLFSRARQLFSGTQPTSNDRSISFCALT
jgi:hypothetical protein